MTENLRLEFDGNTTYDSSTTNLALGTTITPSATQARTAAPTAQERTEWRSNNPLTETQVNRWLSRATQSRRESSQSSGDLTGENQLLGVYYNWYTATASTGTYSTEAWQTTISDICPANWQLPQLADGKSWSNLIITKYALIKQQGTEDKWQTGLPAVEIAHGDPFSIPFSSRVDYLQGHDSMVGAGGYFHSSSTVSDTLVRAFSINHTPSIWPNGELNKAYGISIRCIAQ